MRKARNSKVPKEQLLTPFNVMDFGSENDPCFGSLYDLTTDECQACGDNELCSISFINSLKRKRLEYENHTPVKDLEIDALELNKEINEYYSIKVTQGFTDRRIRKNIVKKFHIHESKVNDIIKLWEAADGQ